MTRYRLSNETRDDLIRIYQYGLKRFGLKQANIYLDSFYQYFDLIVENPFAYESIDYIKKDYRRCVCGIDSIYFKINEGVIEIMAIVGRQDLRTKL